MSRNECVECGRYLASFWVCDDCRDSAAIRFRVSVACDGYGALMEDDVPEGVVCDEDYMQGARDAAEAIRAALEGSR